MATREDGWHSLATALGWRRMPAPSCRCSRWRGQMAQKSQTVRRARLGTHIGLPGQGAELSSGRGRTDPNTEIQCLGQLRLQRTAAKAAQQHSHPRLSALPVLGRDPLFPAVSINEFKHFPAQQLESLLVLHLCLINEIASNLNIS